MTKYLIDFRNNTAQASIDSYLAEHGCSVITVFSKLNNTYHVQAEQEPPVTDIVEFVINDDAHPIQLLEVVNLEEPKTDFDTIQLDSHSEKDWWKVYSVNGVNLDQDTNDVKLFGQGINVYVVDSGIELSHPEFDNKAISLIYSFTGEYSDTNGHGTALSSVITGKTCAISEVNLGVVKIFDQNQPTKQSDLLNAFDAIIRDAELSTSPASVVNLSWAIPRNTYIESKIQHLLDMGISVVCAAGNSGVPIGDVTPAAMDGVIVVGSYNPNFTPSNFSDYTDPSHISVTLNETNYGKITSWAPGEKIWSAALNGAYAFSAGTSIATAIYSASIAYNLSQDIEEDGNIADAIKLEDGKIKWIRAQRRDRLGILDLSDPKYSASVNKICTFNETIIFNPEVTLEMECRRLAKIVAAVGGRQFVYWFNPEVVAQYEILTPVPEGISLSQRFMLYQPLVEPTSDTGVDVAEINIRLYPRDGSSPVETIMSIVKLASTFNASELPEDDPLLDIVLMGGNCQTVSATNCNQYTCQTVNSNACYNLTKLQCRC